MIRWIPCFEASVREWDSISSEQNFSLHGSEGKEGKRKR
jgi:hypothetical protein